MAFKSLFAVVAVALLAAAPLPQTQALSLGAGHNDAILMSRVPHSSLTRRGTTSSGSGKRCPSLRTGKTPPKPSSASINPNPSDVSTTKSESESSSSSSSSHDAESSSSPATTKSSSSSSKPATTKSSSSSAKPATSKTPTSTKATATTPKTTATPKPTAVSRPKVGLIYSDYYSKARSILNGEIFGSYDWQATRPGDVSASDWIPTLKPGGGDGWDNVKEGYAYRAFGCNEVNNDGQSNISPGEGVSLWKQYMTPLQSKGYQLYSHSTDNSDSGFDWHDSFKSQCPDCFDQIDAMNAHIYTNDPSYARSYIQQMHSRYGKKIVISECACANFGSGGVAEGCDADGIAAFVKDFVQWAYDQDYIIGVFYFGAFTQGDPSGNVPPANAMYTSGGSLTSVGKAVFA